jgi:hypothetical protein
MGQAHTSVITVAPKAESQFKANSGTVSSRPYLKYKSEARD